MISAVFLRIDDKNILFMVRRVKKKKKKRATGLNGKIHSFTSCMIGYTNIVFPA